MTNFDSKGTKWSANVKATNLSKMFFKNASLNVNRRQSKIRSLHTYGVLWIHWCVVYCKRNEVDLQAISFKKFLQCKTLLLPSFWRLYLLYNMAIWYLSLQLYIVYNVYPYNMLQSMVSLLFCIGTSYLPKFQKRAVTNLKNYSTKNDENLRKPKGGQ